MSQSCCLYYGTATSEAVKSVLSAKSPRVPLMAAVVLKSCQMTLLCLRREQSQLHEPLERLVNHHPLTLLLLSQYLLNPRLLPSLNNLHFTTFTTR